MDGLFAFINFGPASSNSRLNLDLRITGKIAWKNNIQINLP